MLIVKVEVRQKRDRSKTHHVHSGRLPRNANVRSLLPAPKTLPQYLDTLRSCSFCTSKITLLYRLHTMHRLRTGLLAYENLILELYTNPPCYRYRTTADKVGKKFPTGDNCWQGKNIGKKFQPPPIREDFILQYQGLRLEQAKLKVTAVFYWCW